MLAAMMKLDKFASLFLRGGGILAFLLSSSTTVVASPLRGRSLEEARLPGEGNGSHGQGEIYGGTAASAGEYPAFALLCFSGSTTCGGCGGVLVASQYVLTAAHCMFGSSSAVSDPATGVRIGASQSQTDGTYVAVSQVIIHPDLVFTNSGGLVLKNDVAVLKLASAVTGVTPMSYNRDSNYPSTSGASMTAIGYGHFDNTNTISSFLRKTALSFLPDASCSAGATAADNEVICAQGTNTGACPGDSGGPLFDSNNLIMGMWSFVSSTCGVSSTSFNWAFDSWNYATWIDEQIGVAGSPTPAPTSAPTACGNCFTIAWNNLVSFWDGATTALEASASRFGFGDNVAV